MPTLAIDFSLGGLASLPVVLLGLPLYALLRGTPRKLKQKTIESVAVWRVSTSGSERSKCSRVGSAPPA